MKRKSKTQKEQAARCARFMDMTDAAAELISSTIDAVSEQMDPKNLKAITGALKDLRDLIDDPPGADRETDGGMSIRIENDIFAGDDGGEDAT